MSFWRPLAHGLRVLFNRRAADEAVGDEVQHYFDETVDTYLARGLSREEPFARHAWKSAASPAFASRFAKAAGSTRSTT